ncbi:hypothetical protein SAMN05192539_104232 [Paraburkholderia diazotrophica]|uniref:Uncharacterized protein n=1 Tax=Paraburkholderia diazotrophica TaxID=667676 RepID=A0A1H7E9S3_9BURK|nr:hypothetical protein SAMN05192539_104232 [Paraburkholderia diazotrophica]
MFYVVISGRANARPVQLLTSDQSLSHSVVLVELSYVTLPAPRARTLRDIGLAVTARRR